MSSSFSMADAWAKMGSKPTCIHPTIESVCNAPNPRTKIERVALPIIFPFEKEKLPKFITEVQCILRTEKEKYKETFIRRESPVIKQLLDTLPQESCKHHYAKTQTETDLNVIFAHLYRMFNSSDKDHALCTEVFFKLFNIVVEPDAKQQVLLTCLSISAIGHLTPEDAVTCSERLQASREKGSKNDCQVKQPVHPFDSFCNACCCLIERKSEEGINILEELTRDPDFKDVALQLVLVHKRNRSDFRAIEKILADHIDMQPKLNGDTQLLFLDLQFQLLLRQGLYQEAEQLLNEYKAFPQGNSLRLARQAQIMIQQHKPGNNLVPAYIALFASWNISTTRQPLLPWFFHYEISLIKIEYLWLVGKKQEAEDLYIDYFETSSNHERGYAADCKNALCCDKDEQMSALQYYKEHYYTSTCPELLAQVLELYNKVAPGETEKILETAQRLVILESGTVGRYKSSALFYVWKYTKGTKDDFANEQQLISCLLNNPGPDPQWIVNHYFYLCVKEGRVTSAFEFSKKWLSKFHFIPTVFIEFAKQASMLIDHCGAVKNMLMEILLEQNTVLSQNSRSDLFHALGYLSSLNINHLESMKFFEQANPQAYGTVSMALGGLNSRLSQIEESIKAFEHGFFSMWLKANYKTFVSDSGIDWVDEVYVRMYVKNVFSMHRLDKTRAIEHLNQFLDTMPIQTGWKNNFIAFLTCEIQNQVTKIELAKNGKQEKSEKLSQSLSKNASELNKKLVYQEIKNLFIHEVVKYSREIVDRYIKDHEISPTETAWSLHAEKALGLTEPSEILREILLMKIHRHAPDDKQLQKPFQAALNHLYQKLKEYKLDKEVACVLTILSDNQFSDLIEGTDYRQISDMYKHCLTDEPEMMKLQHSGVNHKHFLVDLGMAVAYFASDEESDPITAVYLKRLLSVDRLSNSAALYLLTWYKDRGNLVEIERFLTSERKAGIERDEDFKLLSRDLWFQIEYAKGNFLKVVEMVQNDLLKEPHDPFLLARLAVLKATQFVQGSSITLMVQLMNQAELHFKKKSYPPCLVYEFELMRMFFLLDLKNFPHALDIAMNARQYSSYPAKTFVPELQRMADLLTYGPGKAKQEADQAMPLILDHFLNESFIPEYAISACFALMLSKKVCKEDVLKVNRITERYMQSPMSKPHQDIFAFLRWWSSLLSQNKECVIEHSELKSALLHSQRPNLIGNYYIVHRNFGATDVPQQLLKEWLVKYSSSIPRLFTYFAQTFMKQSLAGEILSLYRILEASFSKNVDFLYALAMLNEGKIRDAYLDKCVKVDPQNAYQYLLVALKASKDKASEAHQYLEIHFRAEYKRTSFESFWPGVQFTPEHENAMSLYLELLYTKYQHKQEVADHAARLLNEFLTPSGWLTRFNHELANALADSAKKNTRNRKEKKGENQAEMHEKIRQGREAFLKEQEENYRRLMQQEQERLRQFEEEKSSAPQVVQPAAATPRIAQDEIDNRHHLMARRAMDKEELRHMLDAGQSAIPRRSRFTLENALKMADDFAKESRRVPNPEPAIIPQPKIRERFVPTGQSEMLLPIATTVLTPANPAAAPKVYHQDVFSIVTDHENARLRQAYTCLSNMEGILKRGERHEYPPELHDFIIQRALMYQLLRLGECLFPQSATVRKNLSQNYQITMDKIVGREMLAMIRNQLRHEFRNVTLARVSRVCEELLKSNLKKNIHMWHEYNEKPHNVSALVKTSLSESCKVADDGKTSAPPLGFLMGELKKLGSLLDKIGDDVLAMNPDLVATVKMSVCIVGEMAKTERRIHGLDQFIEPSNKVAHEFGEDCEFYTTDEVSLFNIKPYVALAKNIYNNFCK